MGTTVSKMFGVVAGNWRATAGTWLVVQRNCWLGESLTQGGRGRLVFDLMLSPSCAAILKPDLIIKAKRSLR